MSVFRMSLLSAAFGIVIIVVGFIAVSLEQAGYRAPLDIDPAPSMELLRTYTPSATSRNLYYQSAEPTESLVTYYDARIVEFYGADPTDPERERCLRRPEFGDFDNYEEGNGIPPFEVVCVFDRAGLNGSQLTRVNIQPGVLDTEAGIDNRGISFVTHEQLWEP